ncbi:MAG TPA: Spy/CpxP family protein refolding chaperone [Gemmatimonadaceae bacterium]|jgi:Spy/CpxP family protein refolding chaperone
MKGIRIALLGTAILLGTAAVAPAQIVRGTIGEQGGRPRGGMQMNGIELTDAQKTKLDEIQRKYQPEMLSLREQVNAGGDRAELMKKAMALRERSAGEIRAILTPDQQTVFDKNMAEQRARFEQMQQRRAP